MTRTSSYPDPIEWLTGHALPFWSRNGFDAPGRGVWEGLGHDGRPLPDMIKRMRVQARQALVFASASAAGHGDFRHEARAAFAFLTQYAYDPATGSFHALLDRDGLVTDRTQDLYDLAFVLLAMAQLKAAGEEAIVAEWLPRWKKALTLQAAHRGWLETPEGRLPRRQNPHMHMFEATLGFYELGGEPAFLDMAETCLDLFRTVFLDKATGLVFEYFDADWQPVARGEQVIEPGHMVEWVFLLSEYERVVGKPCGVDLRALFDRAIGFGLDARGEFLLDRFALDGAAISPARRMWPQTELLKATRILARMGETLPAAFTPDAVYGRFYANYLDTPIRGGWYDQFNAEGRLISTYMPSSSFYHVYSALTTYAERG
ncbi:AGE family epimerase/isomerase [Pelagibacterium xiamenense]|uniref:AGE family epimerase/isomerase n=1 Tax=Pelagibacterium xiamenense TaxID=2901140 RepID=UPI001E602334|nr:AGE family epimerase/isomerase [Pelagibacterium xiamenense]MCD7061401.1 AGE family epimerase/isomerase [Pelagibacterium xiamenense]